MADDFDFDSFDFTDSSSSSGGSNDSSFGDLDFGDLSDGFGSTQSGNQGGNQGGNFGGNQGGSFGSSDDFGDLAQPEQDGKKGIKKTALYSIIAGVVLIIVIFSAIALINKINKGKDKNTGKETPVSTQQQEQNITPVFENPQPQVNQPVESPNIENPRQTTGGNTPTVSTNNTNSGSNSWKEFTHLDTQITFQNEYIDTIFTVTSVHSYVKKLSDESIEMKTVVSGILSGFEGTFELTCPYYLGYNIEVGNKLDVKVHLGSTDTGITLVDDIVYTVN